MNGIAEEESTQPPYEDTTGGEKNTADRDSLARLTGPGAGLTHPREVARRVQPDDAELLHAEAQRIRVQPEPLGGIPHAVDAPAAVAKHALDVRALHRRQRVGHRLGAGQREVRVEQLQRVAGRVNQRALDDVL